MPYEEGLTQVGYHDLDGRAGFKLAMQEVEGRFFLYAGSMWEPGLILLEVTDPASPRLVRFIRGPVNTWTIQVQVADRRMITALEHIPPGWGETSGTPEEGFHVWDVGDPEEPRQLGTWHTGATGTHRNYYDGGRYVHAAAARPGFSGRIYAVVDIDDPTAPKVVGSWWYPGQNRRAGERFTAVDEHKRSSGCAGLSESIALHGGAYKVGERVYCPWSRGGMVTLDISDVTAPRWVSTLSAYPPLGSSCGVHTVVPIPERGLAVINDEAMHDRRREPLNFAAIVDISNECDPMFISMFPIPRRPDGAPRDFFDRGGRFGPHNQHQPQGQPCLQASGDLIYLTYFNAGLQVFDISDPREPQITAFFIPDDPIARRGPQPAELVTQVEDVLVDRRGYCYITEKNSGLTILALDD